MSMRFMFTPREKVNFGALNQGDLLEKTPEIVEMLSQAHNYYAEADDYTHFLILTQSCDLVTRGRAINAPYITICAVRPLSVVVEKYFAGKSSKIEMTDIEVAKLSLKQRFSMFMERIIHNTEDGFFYIPSDGVEVIREDLCAFLNLSVALRPSHYDVLLRSKIAQLEDIFCAKLGWLKGNIYARVATPDIEEHVDDPKLYKKEFVERHLRSGSLLWLSAFQQELLIRSVKEFAEKNALAKLTEDQSNEIIGRIPKDIEIIAMRIVDKLIKNKIIDGADEDLVRKTKKSIQNVSSLKMLINQLQ